MHSVNFKCIAISFLLILQNCLGDTRSKQQLYFFCVYTAMVFLMISKNHILDVLTLLLVSSGTTVLSQLTNQNSYLHNFHKMGAHSSLMFLQFPRLIGKCNKNSQLNNYVRNLRNWFLTYTLVQHI